MAYFGNKPAKPGSKPGAGSGFAEREQIAHRRAVIKRLERGLTGGRSPRAGRAGRNLRTARAAR